MPALGPCVLDFALAVATFRALSHTRWTISRTSAPTSSGKVALAKRKKGGGNEGTQTDCLAWS